MTYTDHGYHIPGTDWDNAPTEESALCGGPKDCTQCMRQVGIFVGTPDDHPAKAKKAVRKYIDDRWMDHHDTPPVYEVYVVIFAYILGGWKAEIGSTMPDGMYYEVTYDKIKKCTYVDARIKFENVTYRDDEL